MQTLLELQGMLILSIIIVGCAGSGLQIESNPLEADIFLLQPNQAPSPLGKTPLQLKDDSLPPTTVGYHRIQVQKDGFLPESLLIPTTLMGTKTTVVFKLNEVKAALTCERQGELVFKASRGVAQAQALLARGKLEEAEQVLKVHMVEFPDNSVFCDLLGNIYYLKKDYDRALASYKKSNEITPGNLETIRMIKKIEEFTGKRSISSDLQRN